MLSKKDRFHTQSVEEHCKVENDNFLISIKEVIDRANIQIIDVREPHETPKIESLDLEVTLIPLSELEQSIEKINPEKQKAIFCQSGIRSKRAVSILNDFEINNCYSIIEGAPEIHELIK